METNKIKGWLKLLSVKGIGRSTAIKLAKTLGEPYDFIYKNPLPENKYPQLPINFSELFDNENPPNWNEIENAIKARKIGFVSILDDLYPEMLKQIFDPPPFLFYKGEIKKSHFNRTIAIVGTRKPTTYGKISTAKIAKLLCEKGFTIISGLAYGIDSIAHKTAVDNQTYTVAVLGTSIDNIYPPGNIRLAEKIIENGVIFSEIPPKIKTDKWSFPERNRIISGLSLGTVVIEGSKKSGSLITAQFAIDQNRDVFALPGDINKIQAEGPNFLIKNGAIIITKPSDILENYSLLGFSDYNEVENLSKREEMVYQLIKQHSNELTFDKILIKTSFSYAELSTVVLTLELKNLIKKTISNKYIALV